LEDSIVTLGELVQILNLVDPSRPIPVSFRGALATQKDWDALQILAIPEASTVGRFRNLILGIIGATFPTPMGSSDRHLKVSENHTAYFDGAELSVTTVMDWLHSNA
jgi:hypothetical protein